MKKLNNYIEIRAHKRTNDIEIIKWGNMNEESRVIQKYTFDDSQDFCKFILKLARDIGLGRMEFSIACNKVADQIADWNNLS